METVYLVIVVVAILAYYGFMRSAETAAQMANDEIQHGADVHAVSIINRTARLDDKLTELNVVKAAAVKAKIKAMREGEDYTSVVSTVPKKTTRAKAAA
jgi:hypothetical protein